MRGTVLFVVVVAVLVTAVVLSTVGVMFYLSRRAAARLRGDLRAVDCRTALADVLGPVLEAYGSPWGLDPALAWVGPCRGPEPGCREGALAVTVEGAAYELRVVPAGSRLLVWLWRDGSAVCRGDALRSGAQGGE